MYFSLRGIVPKNKTSILKIFLFDRARNIIAAVFPIVLFNEVTFFAVLIGKFDTLIVKSVNYLTIFLRVLIIVWCEVRPVQKITCILPPQEASFL